MRVVLLLFTVIDYSNSYAQVCLTKTTTNSRRHRFSAYRVGENPATTFVIIDEVETDQGVLLESKLLILEKVSNSNMTLFAFNS